MLADEFGKFIAQTRYENLPAAVVETAKLRVLDLLGAALAGYQLGRYKQLLPILGGRGKASAWGLGKKLPVREATLFNSFLSHSVYLDDGSRFTGGHPSSVVIPSALALAETERATGRDLIAAVVVGYEVFLRLGRAIYPSTLQRGFQSTSVTGAAASASACASVLRFSPVQAKHALAIGSILGVGLIEASTSSGSQPIQVARSCEGGVMAALFAGQGAQGADRVLERGFLKAFADNPATADILAGLGADFRIFETYTKIHGGCRGNHAPVDLVQEMTRNNQLGPGDIASILIRVDSVTDRIAIQDPANGNQAQYSVAFSVAVALINGDASIFQYTDAMLADPGIRAMMSRIQVVVDKELDKGYPDKRSASAEIVLADGRRFQGYMDNARGEPECPFSAAEIVDKFMILTRGVLRGGGGRVCDLVLKLESLEDLGVLTASLKARAATLDRQRRAEPR